MSADGRLVAFTSRATNLTPGDTNAASDVFVRDTHLGTTRRVSVSSSGAHASAESFNPAISPDGRHVTFLSYADDLVPGDTNGRVDAFVHDLDTGATVRVNEGPAEPQGLSYIFLVEAAPSRSARTIAFVSQTAFVPEDTNAGVDVYVRDMTTGEVELVSVAVDGLAGGGVEYAPSITPDGRFVAFTSASPSMTPGDTNAQPDVFVRDLLLETTRRVSVTTEGFELAEAATIPSISADGRFVSFRSLGSVWVRDLVAQRTLSLSVDVSNQPTLSDVYTRAPISADGRYVAFGAVNADDWDMDSYAGIYNIFVTPVPR